MIGIESWRDRFMNDYKWIKSTKIKYWLSSEYNLTIIMKLRSEFVFQIVWFSNMIFIFKIMSMY